MSDQRLSLPDTAVLLVLMAEAREVSNPELKQRYGLTLDGVARRRLNDRKLVESWKDGRSFRHVLTDGGWVWCTRQLSADGPPPRSGSGGIALYAVLAGLGRLMVRVDLSLAEVFGATPAPAAPSGPEPAPTSGSQAELDEAGVDARVRAAYRELTPRPNGWVKLAQLREKLADLDRAEVDAALLRMVGQPGVSVVPESNQKALTAADRAAAVRVGGQEKHLLAIGV
ncbi:hypothetical protein [Micromonospora sp. NBC_01813]|uniref:hypothetical protein n=1 Tax=Micromonospora sp. NBC_01813 TaxID=2975988 RepID=UPI002DD7FAEB|nr:hypothetical protein [Micromonospora sp. NBC_01813]WSA10190.1 hypothetical protein OG958_05170 [Micromonospora sp. NBC_01813]